MLKNKVKYGSRERTEDNVGDDELGAEPQGKLCTDTSSSWIHDEHSTVAC